MVAAWRCKHVAGRSRVELVETEVEICLASRDHDPVRIYEGKGDAEPPISATPSPGPTPATGSFLCTACLGDFRVGSPAQG